MYSASCRQVALLSFNYGMFFLIKYISQRDSKKQEGMESYLRRADDGELKSTLQTSLLIIIIITLIKW